MQINKNHSLSLFAQWMRRDKNARSEMALSNISHAWTLKTRRYTWVFFKLTWAESTLCDWRVHQKSKLCTWNFFKVISVFFLFFCIFFGMTINNTCWHQCLRLRNTLSLSTTLKSLEYATKKENNSSSGSVRLCFRFCEHSRIAWGFRLTSHVSFSCVSNSQAWRS